MTTKLKRLSALLMVFVTVRMYAQNTIIQYNVQKHLTYICADDMKRREPELFLRE